MPPNLSVGPNPDYCGLSIPSGSRSWCEKRFSTLIVTLPLSYHGPPRHGTAPTGTTRPPWPPPSQERSHLDLLRPRRHPTASAELSFRGSDSQRSTLAWRCQRRRHRVRWTPRRRFQVRSVCPRGGTDGPRPGQCPGTRGAGDSGRARQRRTGLVRPQSALPSSLLPSPHLPPCPTRLPCTRGTQPPA